MRRISILSILSLAISSAASAQSVARQTRFASIQATTVVNEVTAGDRFYFEKCDYYHVDGVNPLDEIAAQRFVNCNSLGLSQPLEARPRALAQLDRDFIERRHQLSDPNVLLWGLTGAVQGGLIGGLGAVGFNRLFPNFVQKLSGWNDPVKIFTTFGSFSAIVTGWSSANTAIKRQGKNRSTLDLVDPTMPTNLYLLDQRTNDRRSQLKAMDNITDVITRTMTDFVP